MRLAVIFLLISLPAFAADVTVEKLDPSAPDPDLKGVTVAPESLRDPTASERNAMLRAAGLLPLTDGLDELAKDLLLHRVVDQPLEQVRSRYASVTLAQKEALVREYARFTKSLH